LFVEDGYDFYGNEGAALALVLGGKQPE